MTRPERQPAERPAPRARIVKAPQGDHPVVALQDGDDAGRAQPVIVPAAAPAAAAPPQAAQESGSVQAPAALPTPPKRTREVRDLLGTKLTLGTIERLKAYARREDYKIQDVVELALVEFLDRRGG